MHEYENALEIKYEYKYKIFPFYKLKIYVCINFIIAQILEDFIAHQNFFNLKNQV